MGEFRKADEILQVGIFSDDIDGLALGQVQLLLYKVSAEDLSQILGRCTAAGVQALSPGKLKLSPGDFL